MKRTIAIIAMITATFILTAGTTNVATPYGKDLKRQINKTVVFPEDTPSTYTGTVDVTFFVNPEGRLNIIEINSDNDRLRKYVFEKLEKIELTPRTDETPEFHRYRFNFKKEV
jgi:hypothetical protein